MAGETMDAAVTGRGLTVAYGGQSVLDAWNFSFATGSVTALVGPNGSGKSTLLSAIAGLVGMTAGRLTVLGERPGARSLSTRLAYVLQSTPADSFLPVTVREVVTMGRFAVRGHYRRLTRLDRRVVDEALERLVIDHLAERHLRDLSGGERQRVLVAQGLAQQAELLLLDEPLTGLDLPSAERIAGVIEEFRHAGGTVVLATHDLREAERADRVVLMAGRLVAHGAPTEVITTENLLATYGGRLEPMEAHPHAHAAVQGARAQARPSWGP